MSTEWARQNASQGEGANRAFYFCESPKHPAAASLFSCQLPLDGCLFPPPVDGHNQKRERESMCLSLDGPLLGELLTSFSYKWSPQTGGNRPSPHPFPGQLIQWQPLSSGSPPGIPSSVLPTKLKLVASALIENSPIRTVRRDSLSWKPPKANT